MLVKTLVAAHPGLLESLVYLHSLKDERLIRDDEFQRDAQRPTHNVGERSAYALEWVHRQCSWENLPGALYEYVFLTGADKPVSSEIRELVVAQIRQLEKDVRIEQFWEAVVQKFPSDSYWNNFTNDQFKEESSTVSTIKSPKDLRPSSWFVKKTKKGITAEMLRQSVKRGKLTDWSTDSKAHNRYSIEEVCGVYPEYSCKLNQRFL